MMKYKSLLVAYILFSFFVFIIFILTGCSKKQDYTDQFYGINLSIPNFLNEYDYNDFSKMGSLHHFGYSNSIHLKDSLSDNFLSLISSNNKNTIVSEEDLRRLVDSNIYVKEKESNGLTLIEKQVNKKNGYYFYLFELQSDEEYYAKCEWFLEENSIIFIFWSENNDMNKIESFQKTVKEMEFKSLARNRLQLVSY